MEATLETETGKLAGFRIEDLDPQHYVDLDLAEESVRQNGLKHMREWANRGPFYCNRRGIPVLVCGRYADAQEIYLNPDIYTVEMPQIPGYEIFDLFAGAKVVLTMDGADHARIRRLMMPAFMPAGVKALEEATKKIVNDKLDLIESKGDTFDAMGDFAADIISQVLLGAAFNLTPEQQKSFERAHNAYGLLMGLAPGEPIPQEFLEAIGAMRQTMLEIFEDRRKNPTTDMIGKLVHARDNEDKLSDEELIGQINAVCGAALGTTATSICTALLTLGRNPDQFDMLKADPSMTDMAVTECLRYQSTGFFTFPRFAKKDTELAGVKVPKNMVVLTSAQATNYDPAVYPDPEKFDIKRNPQAIMTFGTGAHHCIGNRLARMVIRTSLEQMMARFPNLRLDDPDFEPVYQGMFGEMSPNRVPMRTN
ncbi:hypothetical protein JT55_01365 [Rhodovulum sp. NI22]|uniref:cytochrome P450 n=1 Tax=Actibacterium sp. TaxID=1872125 RepID=UPI00051002B2|nr:cytochrome P450 [Actibacterium sp.]KGB83811.1 hypothetical protein JT55_01365 [Rhodovulum sp. NI22]